MLYLALMYFYLLVTLMRLSVFLFSFIAVVTTAFAQPADSIRKEVLPTGISPQEAQRLSQDFLATGDQLYAAISAVWTDDSLRAVVAKRFAREHPQYEYWVCMAYRIALASYDKLKQPDSIAAVIPGWIADYPNDPLALATSAYFYLYYNIDTLNAAAYAARAVTLLPRYQTHPFFTEKRYSLDVHGLYNSAWLGVAWAHIQYHQYEQALAVLTRTLRETPSTLDDSFSPVPFHYLFGLAYQGLNRNDSALCHFAKSYQYGEGRNRWTTRAENDFIALAKKVYSLDTIPVNKARALMRASASYTGVFFEDVTVEKGMDKRIDQRAAWGDCDNDGWPDLLVEGRTLWHNNGAKEFEKIELPGDNRNMIGGLWGDYDNDGLLDIYSIASGWEKLWHNNGDCSFSDVTAAADSVTNEAFTEGAAWFDADNDGFLDLYLANYEQGGRALMDEFWHNEHGQKFTEKGALFGLREPDNRIRAGRGVAPCDYDNDGDVDVYISNYRLADNLLLENQGAGALPQFINTAPQHGIDGVNVSGSYGHTTGSAWGDYDNDGDFDLITANMSHPRYIDFNNRTMLYENLGAPNFAFRDRRVEAGLVYEETQTDAGFADFDGDGWLDIFITSTYEDRRSFLYLNNRNGTFREVTGLANARVMDGFGWAVADYDLDGDLDLVVGTGWIYKTGLRFLENKLNDNPETRVHWLHVRVKGKQNTWGFGAVVRATQQGQTQMRQIVGGRGTTSQDYPTAYFGFGKNNAPVQLEITLPNGAKITKTVTQLDRVVEVEE